MPIIEILLDSILQRLSNTQNGHQAYVWTMDFKNVYSQH